MSATAPAPPAGRVRWGVCALLFAAVALSYVDRLVLPVLKPELQARYGWDEAGYADLAIWFQGAYGLSYLCFGRLVDRLGAKLGYGLAVGLWTVGHLAHIAFTSTRGLLVARVALAVGEAGAFPAGLAAANAWFPDRERALAIGLFNAGANVGAILTPLAVPAIAAAFGWRMAFVATGALTVLWLAAWLRWYHPPERHPRLSAAERAWIAAAPASPARPVPWRRLLRHRQVWAYAIGRFMIDPVWWTFLFWLPDFFNKQYGVRMLDFGPPLVAVYLMADAGSVLGGLASSRLVARGWALGAARKGAMAGCALLALPIAFAAHAPGLWTAVLLIGLACAAHQGFSANLYALPGDLMPRGEAGTVIGMGGLSGAVGGMLMAHFAGAVLDRIGGYGPIFTVAASAYLAALLMIQLFVPRYCPILLNDP